jgi:hypothetical protein
VVAELDSHAKSISYDDNLRLNVHSAYSHGAPVNGIGQSPIGLGVDLSCMPGLNAAV